MHSTHHLRRPHGSRRHGAFSIVELLVVVAIIIALMSILIVALGLAAKRATSASTQFLLGSISKGLVQFQNDVGYLPPILGRANTAPSAGIGLGRDFVPPPRWLTDNSGAPTQASIDAYQDWYSYTSLAEYLLGYGDRFADGYGAMGSLPAAPAGSVGAKEVPLLGIRSPGSDSVWGAISNPLGGAATANGRFAFRNVGGFASNNANGGNQAVVTGKTYGPYLDLKDDALLGGLAGFDNSGEPQIILPGQPGYSESMPKVILDYWGKPIHYYRRAHVVAGTASGNFYTAINFVDPKTYEADPVTSSLTSIARDIGDIFALRPSDFQPGEDVVGVRDANGDGSTLMRMKSANFALMSRGPDKQWDRNRRRGGDDLNKDNVVEIGQ